MKVTIIIPVYNVENYIARCLKSVMCQTYSDELECILVDDCGKDNSIAIAERLIAEFNLINQKQDIKRTIEFQILHHSHNRGLSAARNTGTEVATGDYIFYLDSDDELPVDCIQILVEKVYEYPGIDMVQGCTKSIPEMSYYDITCFESYSYVADNKWIRFNYYKQGKNIPANAWNKLLKTSLIRDNNLLFKEGVIHEDECWMWFLVKCIKSMAFVFIPTYYHYMTPDSIMRGMTPEKHATAMAIIIHEWICHVDAISYHDQLKKILTIYRNIGMNYYYKENDGEFVYKVAKVLLKYRQYKSLAYLCIWCYLHKNSIEYYNKIIDNLS